jgi:hypothetical protein
MKIIDLKNCPGIFIPCDNLDSLKILIDKLYEKEILQGESFKLCNVDGKFMDELYQTERGLHVGETVRISESGDLTVWRE